VTLDFTRPAGSARAKLAINIVNTPWAGMCLKRLLELVGRDLYGWYAELDAFPIRAHLVDSTMIRESGLQIWLRDGDEWQLQTAVRAVGSAVPEDHVVWLDVPATESDTLTIRLESTAGFWIIDEAVIDWSPDAVVTASECSLVSAVDWQRQDVRAALKEADGVYCELPAAGNDVETAFAAPSRISGTDRSYMLACAGYYTINVDTSAAPQPELIAQMATVPGAFGKYMLRSLEQQLTAVINR
jgi:hypothetical protein